ncbi:E3 binding domain-containing protein [Natronomonas sp. LN261]|uniref:E3 binding domain-containing protein n=1 Tax=Natronomonas sp. LN261 TaxID=2750669 RepID=UPI001C666854|nr:E3 binding domain-containing protein [Natronomonas sp. LN261]
MATIVKMPKLGLEMEQGTVLEWFFRTGEEVSEGDKIAEVESEKSIGEVDARESGAIRRIYIEAGESVPPGTPIGILADSDADVSELEAEAEAELEGDVDDESGSDPEPTGAQAEDAEATDRSEPPEPAASSADETDQIKASPRAKKRAEELGVDLAGVDGTGPMDSITADDVEAASDDGGETDQIKASPRAKKRAEELGVDLAGVDGTGPMDSITADDVEAAAETEPTGIRTGTSETTAGRYRRVTAVAGPAAGNALLETTESVRSAFEEHVTVTDVLLVVTSDALADRPLLNGTYTESTHQVQARQDVALVTERDGEPVAGVIPDVETKSLTGIVAEREAIEEDAGGRPTFTLENTADSDADGPRLIPPSVAALEVDPSGQRAVPDDGGVDLQPLVTASLSYDTRALGRREAESFLERLFDSFERASELALQSYRGTE